MKYVNDQSRLEEATLRGKVQKLLKGSSKPKSNAALLPSPASSSSPAISSRRGSTVNTATTPSPRPLLPFIQPRHTHWQNQPRAELGGSITKLPGRLGHNLNTENIHAGSGIRTNETRGTTPGLLNSNPAFLSTGYVPYSGLQPVGWDQWWIHNIDNMGYGGAEVGAEMEDTAGLSTSITDGSTSNQGADEAGQGMDG